MDGWMDSLELYGECAHRRTRAQKDTRVIAWPPLTQMDSDGRGFVYSVDWEFTITLRSRRVAFFFFVICNVKTTS